MGTGMSDDIRSLIREVLAEELKSIRSNGGAASVAPKETVETISITSDADLNMFAKRILKLADDASARADMQAGRLRFQLSGQQSTSVKPPVAAGTVVSFEKGLISEKKIADLEEGSTIRATKAVCFTPLARDEIRRKRIRVERIKK